MTQIRKSAALWLAFCMLTGILAGCAAPAVEETPAPVATETPAPTEAPTPTPEPTPEPTPTPTPEPTPEPTPVPYSYDVPEGKSPTTGLDYEGDYQPILVSIGNNGAARPQWGLSQADIVYEYLMEGQSITRYNAIFSDNKPEKVGPVRSNRVPFVNELVSLGEMPIVFYGATRNEAPYNPYMRMDDYDICEERRVDGQGSLYARYFWRDSSRDAPHNAVIDLLELTEEAELPKVERTKLLLFAEKAADALTETAETVEVAFTVGGKVFASYKYDADAGVYERYVSGKRSRDHEGEQVYANNVIIRHMEYSVYDVNPAMLDTEPLGTGVAEYYIGGKRMVGTWIREELDKPTIYLDAQGNEMAFQPGKTWIEMVRAGSTIAYE